MSCRPLLRIKLLSLDKINSHKRSLAAEYRGILDSRYKSIPEYADRTNVYHIFPVRHAERDRLRAYLLSRGVTTEIHYPIAPNKQVAYSELFPENFPLAEEIHATILSLPISYFHTVEDVRHVASLMNQFMTGS